MNNFASNRQPRYRAVKGLQWQGDTAEDTRALSRFSVCQYFPSGEYEYVRRDAPAAEAMDAFNHYTSGVGAQSGSTQRVIVTDEDDCINVEWRYADGIVFPPKGPPLSKEEAVSLFRSLVQQYGLKWTAKVPREAWDQMERCRVVLTEADRRAALGLSA